MRAIVVTETGGPEVLVHAEEHPDPEPGPGQVVVEAAAAGVNFIDIYRRSGVYNQPLPYVPGSEGAGTVVAVGEGVTDVAVGDRVAWHDASGSYAERVVVDAAMTVPVPDGTDLTAAAAVMLQGMTAHYLCRSTFEVKPGTVAVVHAAAGGVGLLLTQMIKTLGGTVIATTSGGPKAELAEQAGRRLRDRLRRVRGGGRPGHRRPRRRRGLRRRGQGHLRRQPGRAPPARADGAVRRVERPGPAVRPAAAEQRRLPVPYPPHARELHRRPGRVAVAGGRRARARSPAAS